MENDDPARNGPVPPVPSRNQPPPGTGGPGITWGDQTSATATGTIPPGPNRLAGIKNLRTYGALFIIAFFLLVIALLAVVNDRTVFEPPLLLALLNTVFVGIIPLFIAFTALQTYRRRGTASILLLGSGMLVFGLGSIAAGWLNGLPGGSNIITTIHNTSVCVGSALSLAAVLLLLAGRERRERTESPFLPAALYGGLAVFVVGLSYGAAAAILPLFFIQETGPTVIRQVILSSATELYAITSLLFFFLYRRNREEFFLWFSVALGLVTAGLLAIFLQPSVGSLLGWTGRCAQYAGACFALVAMSSAQKEAKKEGIPLAEQIGRFFGRGDPTPAILAAVKDPVWLFGTDGTILMANPTALERFGAGDTAEIIGRNFRDLLPADLARSRGERMEEVMRTGKPLRFEDTSDGIVSDHTYYPVFDRDGKVTGIAAFSRDITANRKAEDAIRDARARTEAILHQIADTFYSLDDQWRFRTVNPAAERAPFGRPASELIGKVIWDLYPALTGTPIEKHYRDAIQNRSLEHYEALSPLNGLWYEVFMQGRTGGVDVYMRDITPRKTAEELLRENEHRERERAEEMSAILDSIPTAVIIAQDPECSHLAGNRAAYELLNLPVGGEISLTAPPEQRPGHVRAMKDGRELRVDELPIRRAARGERVRDFEYTLRFDDGTTRELVASAMPLSDSRGNPRGAVHTLVDITERKRMEEALQESGDRLSLSLAASGQGTWDYDIRNDRVTASIRMEEIYGVPEGGIRSRGDWREPVLEDDIPVIDDAIGKADPATGSYRIQYRIRRATDRAVRWIEAQGLVIRDESGKPVRIAGIVTDITDRRDAEEALARSNAKLTEVLESIQDDFYVLDRDWNFVYTSRNFTSRVGKEPGDFIGKNIWEMFPKHRGTEIDENFRAAMERREVRRFEMGGRYTEAWYSMTVFPSTEGITVLGTDITARRKAEMELRRRQAEIRALFDNIPAGLVLFDATPPYTVLVHNRYYQELFAEPFFSKGMAGLNVHEYAPEVEAAGIVAVFDEAVRTKQPRHFLDFPYRSDPPDERWFNWYIAPIVLEGKVISLVSMSLDVTATHRAEEALRESEEKYRGLFNNVQESVAVYRLIYDEGGKPADRIFVDVNPKAIEEMGYRQRSEIIGKPYSEVVKRHFPDDQKSIDNHLHSLAEVARSGKPVIYDTSFGDRVYITTQYALGKDLVASSSINITSRKKAEDALRQSETQLRRARELLDSVTKNSGVMIAAEDRDLCYTYFNSAYAEEIRRITGRDLAIGMRMNDVFTGIPDELVKSERQWRKVLKGTSIKETISFESPGGGRRTFNVIHSPIRDEKGAVIGAGEVSFDVTRQIQIEDELHETSQFLESLIKYANAPIIVWDPGFRITRFNQAFERLTGLKAREVLGKTPDILIPERYHDGAMDLIRKATTGDRWEVVEIPILHKNGEIRTVLWNSATLYEDDGKTVIATIAQGQDITRRKKLEEMTRVEKKRAEGALSLLNAALESITEGIYVVDSARKVTNYNQNFVSLWNIPEDVLAARDDRNIARFMQDLVGDREGFSSYVKEIYLNPEQESYDMLTLLDGRIFERHSKPQRLGKSIIGRVWSFQDVTERRTAEKYLVASVQEKEILIREIHHRVKNNLQIISGLLDMTRMRTADTITNSILTDMMMKIKTMAQIHTRLYESKQFDRINMGSQIRDQVADMSSIYGRSGTEIAAGIDAEDIYLTVDRAIPCALIVNEILSNAYKHAFRGRPTGTLDISMHREDGCIRIRVRDDGVGIPPGLDVGKAASLGLKLIRSLVRQLNGSFAIESGSGTEVIVEFPFTGGN